MERSRGLLHTAFALISAISAKSPSLVPRLSGEYNRLVKRQSELEGLLSQSEARDQGLGWILPVAIGVGTAISALALWVWKHHEETSTFSNYLQCVESMTKKFESAGMPSDQAAKAAADVCQGRPETLEQVQGVIKWLIFLSAGLGIVYLAFIRK